MNVAFIPWVTEKEAGTADPNLPITSIKRKTKCKHFKEDEFKGIIKVWNKILFNLQFI
jgi:hypothetical protein